MFQHNLINYSCKFRRWKVNKTVFIACAHETRAFVIIKRCENHENKLKTTVTLLNLPGLRPVLGAERDD